jgi:DNA-binding NtrC family response regulator
MFIVVEPHAADATTTPSLVDAQQLHDQIWQLRTALHDEFHADNLIGSSYSMRRVRQQLELASSVTAPVLILGPQGSGREHAARTIHAMEDPQKVAPLVPMSASLLDAELLRNMITTLLQRCAELETEGVPTLLLLDADGLSEETQSELLGMLSIHELGLRTLATSQQSLVELARQSRFNAALGQMLSTIVVELPPLFERPADIPLIAQFFVERHNAGSQSLDVRQREIQQCAGFSQPAVERLMAYGWPGNIDELREVVRECLENTDESLINVEQLPSRIQAGLDAALNPVDVPIRLDLETHLADVERDLIRLALRRVRGNKTQAAKSLGISRAKLLRRIEHLGANDENP